MAWRLLGGVYEPTFIGAMLDDLANHPAEMVRAAVACGLRQYVADRAVSAALENAQSDSSARVRRSARGALTGGSCG
jgi:hypothetical protein